MPALMGKSTAPSYATRYAELYRLPDEPEGKAAGGILVKIARVRKPIERVRRLFLSRGKLEFNGSLSLGAIGIQCPEPLGYGVNINPCGKVDSLFMCRHMDRHVMLSQLYQSMESEDQRMGVMAAVCEDIATMMQAGFVHKDAQFENILADPDQPERCIWIDNDLKRVPVDRRGFEIRRIVDRLKFKTQLGSGDEYRTFENLLRERVEGV